MEEGLKTEYRGFTISYVEGADDWLIHDDGTHGDKRKRSLTECKQWIDNTLKMKKKSTFERQEGILFTHRGYEKVTVTSFAGTEHGRPYYWIAFEGGRREKTYGVKVYNEKIYADIVEKVQERVKITEEINTLYDSLPLFTEGQEEGQ